MQANMLTRERESTKDQYGQGSLTLLPLAAAQSLLPCSLEVF
jgi:hypothetical protein